MSELLQTLLSASLWLCAVVALLAALRPLLRRLGGAALIYRSWWAVPLVGLAPLFPLPAQPLTAMAPVQALGAAMRLPAVPVAGPAWPWILCALWAAGVLVVAALHVRAQSRFVSALGTLRPRNDGSWQACGDPGLPALVGVWQPRIVVGPDFDARFTPAERDLILQHEHSHRRHGDHWANAGLALLRCLFWFHPLLPWAARAFLRDQELACDARTVDPHPALRRLYANALLKARLAHPAAPVACHWRSQLLLKERIAMLKQHKRKALPQAAGQMLVVALCAGLGTGAWASQGTTGAAGPKTVDAQPISTTAPKYPADALARKIAGKVELRVEVGVDGRVTQVEVLSATAPGVFDAAAVDAARQWTFQPARRDGTPVPTALKIPVDFALNAQAPAT